MMRWKLMVVLIGYVLLCGSLPVAGLASEPPRGECIVFLRLTTVHWQLWLMAPDGSSQRQLTHSPVDKVHAAWRPGRQR